MADDRTIAPGPGRLRRAWVAGLRPRASWLPVAAAAGLLAVALQDLAARPSAVFDVRPLTTDSSTWLTTVAGAVVALWIVAAAVVMAVAVLTRQLGGISTRERAQLGLEPARPVAWPRVLLSLALGLGLTMAMVGVLAGAARSVDASQAGLIALWLGWAVQAATAIAVGLGTAGLIELLLDRHDRHGRLFQTRQQVRDQARARGGAAR